MQLPDPTAEPISTERIIISTNDGWYVHTNPDDQGRVIATTREKREATVFVKEVFEHHVALKDEARGMYVRAHAGGNSFLLADATVRQAHELYVEGDAEFGRSLKTAGGWYWSAIGGGGSSVDAVVRHALSHESFHFEPTATSGGGVVGGGGGDVIGYLPPAGLVRMEGWALADDHGPRPMLSVTLMDAETQFVQDRARLQANVEYCRQHGVDFVRILSEVDWPGKEANPRDVAQTVETVRFIWSLGMRVELTIFGSHSRIPRSEKMNWTRELSRALRDANLVEALALVEFINEAGGARVSAEECVEGLHVVQEFLPTVPKATSAPYDRDASTTTGFGERSEEYKNFMRAPATIATPHLDRGVNSAEGEYRICRQGWNAMMMGYPWGNNEPAGPWASAQNDGVMQNPDMQRVHANGTWLQRGAFHCWHVDQGVGMRTDAPLWEAPGLPGLSAVRAILPRDIANFQAKNWHWSDNPVESLRGVRDGNPSAPVRTHGLVDGGRVVLHILGNDHGAELRARSGMRLTRHSWDGVQYVAAEELEVRSGQQFFAPPAPDQIYVGRFL
jgi:hypothetical protein